MLKSLQAVLAAGLLLVSGARAAYPVGTPVAINGQLSVCGTKICNEAGASVQLTGMSSHGINPGYYPDHVNETTIQMMYNTWGVNAIRAAMYTGGYNGYGNTVAQRNVLESKVEEIVDAAEKTGIYALIDWHILTDNDPTTYQAEAITFFEKMATLYKDKKHVIYEICNEPNGSTSWATIKAYAKAVIPKIRAIDPDAIIVVGTPTYSQRVDQAAADPIRASDVGSTGTDLAKNVMYALHFYSGTHKEPYRVTADGAIAKGLPIFVTEWGTSVADGGLTDKTVYTAEADLWIEWMKANEISWCNWSVAPKDEASAALKTTAQSVWGSSDLSASGTYVLGKIKEATANSGLTGPFSLTVAAGKGGTVSASPAPNSGSLYTKGTQVTLKATPAAGYVFAGWTGTTTNFTNPLTVSMNQDVTETANFLVASTGTNLLTNGNFASGTTGWTYSPSNGAIASSSVSAGVFNAGITSGGTLSWHVQLSQGGISLTKGKTYQLTFDARAAAARIINPNVGQSSGNYASYSNWPLVNLTTTTTSYTLTFKMDSASDANARLEFNLGASTINVFLSNVVFSEVVKGNQPPVARDTSLSLAPNAASSIGLKATDTDGTVASYAVLTGPSKGTYTLSGSTVSYTGTGLGQDSIVWIATDNGGAKDTGVVRIVLNNPPKVTSKIADIQALRGTSLSAIALGSVFSDADNEALTYTAKGRNAALLTPTVSGSSLSLALAAGKWGKDTVVVTATDGKATASDTFLVVIGHANILPQVRDTLISTDAGVAVKLKLAAMDSDGTVQSFTVSKQGLHGTATVSRDTLTFTPAAGYEGADTVYVTAKDDSGATSLPARIAVQVKHVNQAPKALGLPDIKVKTGAVIDTIDLSKYFTDIEGDALTYTFVRHSNSALLSYYKYLNKLKLNPIAGKTGIDTVMLSVSDGKLVVRDTFLVVVSLGNAAPVLKDAAMSVVVGGTAKLKLAATDADGKVASYAIAKAAAKGTATVVGDTATYVAANAVGVDTFYVLAKDDSGAADTARIAVTITAANQAPVVSAKLADVSVNQGATIPAINLKNAFTDPEGAALIFTVTHRNAALLSTNTVSGSLTLSLIAGKSGTDTVFVKASDGSLSVSDTFVVTVAAVAEPIQKPKTLADLVLTPGETKQIDLDEYFTSATGANLSFSATGAPGGAVDASVSGGMLTMVSGGVGNDVITVVVTDGTNSVTVSFKVAVSDGKTGIVARPTSRMGGLSMGGTGSVVRPKLLGIMNGAMGTGLAACSQDGECQSTSIALAYAGRVEVDIYDQLGVRVIAWSRVLKDADLKLLPLDSENRRTLDLQWNLRSAAGRLVGSGVYLWKIRVTANDGTWAETVVRQGVSIER